MDRYLSEMQGIRSEKEQMIELVQHWSQINSWSENLAGLSAMLETLKVAFSGLEGKCEEISLPPRKSISPEGLWKETPVGKALSIIKRDEAPLRVVLSGHYDTVYPPTTPFPTDRNGQKMTGQGVADMKGGIVVILKALEGLEKSRFAEKIGWEVLLTPDEEIGSMSSSHLIEKIARRNQIGLVFEPSFEDGTLVSSRKGSINFVLIAKGQSAHVGRDFSKGKNAIHAMAKVIVEIQELIKSLDAETTLNTGTIFGGKQLNVVPDLCISRLNIRSWTTGEIEKAMQEIQKIVQRVSEKFALEIELKQESQRPAKEFDEKTQELYQKLQTCSNELGMSLSWRASGGGSDGSNLAAAGLPTLDTLGVVGGNLHTQAEYLLLDSLTERSCLTLLFLLKLANGEFDGI